MKDGYKTSELYVALSGLVVLLWGQVQSKCNFDYPFLLSVGGIVITYVLGRSWVKSRSLRGPDL